MTYDKPEIAVLGEANTVIQGPKTSLPESPNQAGPAAFELED